MLRLSNLIIEGVDRMGKGTLIRGFLNSLGYHQVIHYQKPEHLECYGEDKSSALEKYQRDCFSQMFCLLESGNMVLDRAHLGEAVYSKRYRGYSGEYVFDLEKQFVDAGWNFHEKTLLVLLTTSDFSFIQDDGLSFDFDKKEEEQRDFIDAFDRSLIKNKLLIDVSNGNGGYVEAEKILNRVLHVFGS